MTLAAFLVHCSMPSVVTVAAVLGKLYTMGLFPAGVVESAKLITMCCCCATNEQTECTYLLEIAFFFCRIVSELDYYSAADIM